MTVGELVAELLLYPQDEVVIINTEHGKTHGKTREPEVYRIDSGKRGTHVVIAER